MKSKPCIAIIDDENSLRQTVAHFLESRNYSVSLYSSGAEAWELLKDSDSLPDLIILDIVMPGIDGITFCSLLRKRNVDIPIIFLSSKVDEWTKIEALERGGDDYMTKPYSINELVTRIEVCLRRVNNSLSDVNSCKYGHFTIHEDAWEISRKDIRMPFSVTEFRIFKTLLTHPDTVFSREELMAKGYPQDCYLSDRNVDTHITRIRKKIQKADPNFSAIESVYGLGYRYRLTDD